MNQLQKAIIEKIGHDFGFEYLVSASENQVVLGSTRHSLGRLSPTAPKTGYPKAVIGEPTLSALPMSIPNCTVLTGVYSTPSALNAASTGSE